MSYVFFKVESAPLARAVYGHCGLPVLSVFTVVVRLQMGNNPVPLGPDPISTLTGFKRVYLEPGQWTVVKFPLDPTALSRVTEDGKRVSVPGTWRLRTEGDELSILVE